MTPNFDQVLSQAKALPPDEQKRLIEALSQAEAPQPALSEEEFQEHLLREGVISELPKPPQERPQKLDFTPINVTGAPLSETIIEERR